MNGQPRFTMLGKLISFVLVLGLVALGRLHDPGALRRRRLGDARRDGRGRRAAPEVSEVKVEVPRLSPPAPFQFKDNIVPIEISEYAGYAGLIAANGGLEPTENSLFFKNHGFKVRLTISEDEIWSRAQRGQDGGVGDDRRRARRVRQAAARGRAGADRLLARRRRRSSCAATSSGSTS